MSDGDGDGLGTGGGRSRFSLPPPPAASFRVEPAQLPPAQSHRRLPSYVSEPPSAMAAMKAYAQELLVVQGDPHGLLDMPAAVNGNGTQPSAAPTPFDQTAAGAPAGGTPPGLPPLQLPQQQGGEAGTPTLGMAPDGSLTPSTAARIDVGQLTLGMKQAAAAAIVSRQHFDLPPTLQPKRPSTESETAPKPLAAGTGGAGGSAAARTPLRPHPHLRTSIGWVCSNSPSSAHETVLEHRVAGDLHVPSMTTQQRGRLMGPGGGGGAGGPRSPSRDVRRRPVLRSSQQPGSVPPSPSPKGMAAGGGQKRGGGAATAVSPSKKGGSDNGEADDLESLDFDARDKPFWKKKTFWLIAGPLTVSAAFLLAAILYITLSPSDTLGQFQIWRLCFFIAGLPIIWWIGRGSMNIAVWAVEKTMFTWQNALYYMYAVRRPMSNVIRAGLATGWWALMMTSFSSNMNSDLVKAYNIVLKLLGCLTLFMTANLLKVLFAKMMASSFNRASHYQKMHDALKREYLLHLLLQPRKRYVDFAEEEEGYDDLGGDGGGEGEGGDMHRSKSAPSDLVHRQLTRVSTLQRLFRPSMTSGLRRHEEGASLELPARRSFKERVMFWRRSKAELQPIEEAEEKEGDTMELRTLASGSTMAGLPSGAVVVDVEGGGAEGGGPASTAGGSQGGSGPSRVPSIAADIPLLEHSPPSIAIRPPPHKRTPPASPSPAATPLARPAVLQSQASLPTGKPPLPAPSPRPPSKLERLRSQALEAARDEVLGKGGHGQGVSRGSAGTEVASLGRRLSSESERAAAMRRPSLGRDWRTPEGSMHGPGSTVHGGRGGTMHGSGSVGGTVHAGVAVGVASREASAAGGATARVTFGRAGPIKRSTSLQSHKSLAPGGKAAAAAAPAVEPVPTKPVLQHANSISSNQTSKQLQMALKMSKMEKYIRKHALEVTFRDALNRVERNEKVTTELEAKRLGFYLFYNVKADFDRDHLVLEDLEEFLDSEKDAKSAMDMLDENGDGKVNVQECCSAITKVFVDRRNLAATLKDTRSIVGKLETVIGVVLHIFMFFLYLIIFNVDVMKTWAGFASLFLGFSFIFGNSIRTTYESVIFLFLAHPYDVGDALWLDNEQVKVEEIHLSMTVMMNGTNGRLYYPNEKLRLIPFINITRSGNKGESFKVMVDMNTPGISGVMEVLRAAGDAVIRASPTEFSSVMAVNLREGGTPLKMTISVYWEFSHTGMDMGRTARSRTRMIAALTEALQKSGVRYTWPAMEGLPLGGPAAAALAGAAAGEAAGADPGLKLL